MPTHSLFDLPSLDQILDRDPLIVTPDTPTLDVLSLMRQGLPSRSKVYAHSQLRRFSELSPQPKSCVIVLDKQQVVGILTERDIVHLVAAQRDLASLAVDQVMTASVITLTATEAADLLSVLEQFRQHRIRHLPIVDDRGHLLGVVTQEQIRQVLHPSHLLRLRTVAEVMTPQVIQADPSASVLQVAQLMAAHQLGCIVVTAQIPIAPEADPIPIPVGIITERDIVQLQLQQQALEQLPVEAVMTTPLLTVSPQESLWIAHQQMLVRSVRRLVVVDETGTLQGLITQTDVLHAVDLFAMSNLIQVLQQRLHEQTAQLQQVNQTLQQEILQRQAVEQDLRQAQQALEQRVGIRTAELMQATGSLQQEADERRRIEAELQQREYQWQALFDNALDAIAIADDEGHYLDVNPAACELFGVAREDLLDAKLLDFADSALDTTGVWDAFLTQGRMTGEFRLFRPDGTVRETEFAAVANFLPHHHLSILRDITDRKQAEAKLKESEERFRQFAENSRGVILLRQIDTNEVLYVNPAYETIWGRSCEDLYQNPNAWADALHPEDIPRIQAAYAAASTQGNFNEEYRIIRPDGTIRWVWGRCFPIQNAVGEVYRMAAIAEDITDRKQAEAELHQQLAREKLIAEITQDIRQTLDLDEVLQRTVQRVRDSLQTDRVIVFRFDPNWQGQVVMESVAPGCPSILATTIADPCFSDRYIAPYRQGRISAIAHVEASEIAPCHREMLTSFQVKANLVVPILQGEQLWGLLIAHHCTAPRDWQSKETEFMRQLANQLGIAIQQSELYQQTRRELLERRRMQEALQASEERFRSLSASAPIGIYHTNPDGICLYANARWLEISGLTLTDCLGNGWTQAIHPGDREAIVTAWQNALHHEQEFVGEFRLLTPQGKLRWVSMRSAPMRSATGEILGYVSTQEDITEHRQAEAALRESEQRLQAILDNSPAVIYLLDRHNRHVLANRRYAELLSIPPDRLIGKSIYEFWPPDVAQLLATNHQQVLQTGQLLQTEEQVPHGDHLHTYISLKFPLPNSGRSPEIVCSISTDITEKKQLEKQFYRAQRLESVGTLAGGIAHDLNNVFTPILAIAQLLPLKFKGLDGRTQELLKTLEDCSRRGADLVKQILTFARGTEGNRISLQAGHLLLEVAKIVEQTFPKSIEICRDISPTQLWLVSADPTHLHQVFMNLAVNARDAMPNGGTLTLAAENRYIDAMYARINLDAHAGPYVVITVADTGMGIAQEYLDRIFDPFFTTKEVGKGTGLGLSTVLGIVKNHGGFVKVSSKVGQGTEFQIYLPAIEQTLANPDCEESQLPQGQGELILIVDDEAIVRQTTQTLLEEYGYRTLLAQDGIEAIALFAEHKIEVAAVLIDIMMPNMDGSTAIRALKRLKPQVPILASSGLAANSQLALSAGADTFLPKPYTAQTLLVLLQDLIGREEPES